MTEGRDREALYICAAAVSAAAGLCLGSMVIDNHRFVVRRYSVSSSKITRPVRILYLTDLHEKDYGKGNAALAEAAERLRPDLILSGGDQVVSSQASRAAEGDDSWYAVSLDLLRRLASIAPVMMAEGNHEARLHAPGSHCGKRYRRFQKALKEAGVQTLHNETAVFGDLRIAGLELPASHYRKFMKHRLEPADIDGYLGEGDPEHFQILLAHDPAFFAAYAGWGADLTLSGHLHGGLMRLPLIGGVVSPAPALFPRCSGGRYSLYGRDLIVSCGLGMHTLPIRIFNPGELTVIELSPKGTIHGHSC